MHGALDAHVDRVLLLGTRGHAVDTGVTTMLEDESTVVSGGVRVLEALSNLARGCVAE